MKSNPIVTKWLPGILIVIVVFVGVQLSKEDDTSLIDAENAPINETAITNVRENNVDLTEEGDTGSDTLNTLVASLKTMKEDIKRAADDKNRMDRENQQLRKRLDDEMLNNQHLKDQVGEIFNKLSNVNKNLEKIKSKKPSVSPSSSGVVLENEYPVNHEYQPNSTNEIDNNKRPRLKPPSFGTDNKSQVNDKAQQIINTFKANGNINGYSEWIMPIDAVKTTDKDGKSTIEMPEFGEKVEEVESQPLTDQEKYENSFSAFATIPRGATLLNSVSLGAMIGRIPIEGSVIDPYKFKALLSAENLASNGIFIDGLEGAIVSGKARGDYTLKCVSGDITSILFTFADGTIFSYPDSAEAGAVSIGYISDDKGIPCISGTLISNAATYLTQSVGLGVLNAGAEAYAAAQTAVTNDGGESTTTVPGDIGKYAAGKAISNGTNTVTSYLDARKQNAYDAVFVPPGAPLTLHIEEQVNIDYIKKGRRTNHYENQFSNNNYYGLD